jgi:hypothetical protein
MHGACWDPDAPEQVYKYINESRVNDSAGLRVYCVYCTKIIDSLRDFESRLLAIESKFAHTLATRNEEVSTNASETSNTSKPSTPIAINPTAASGLNFQEEITEALDKERRKANIIVFNLPIATGTQDDDLVKKLIVDLSIGPTEAFTCNRLGKQETGTKPLLVKFSQERDKMSLLKNAHKLKNLATTYHGVNIAPDRTKREQIHFRSLRQECNDRRKNGEHVIIIKNAIVLDKRFSNNMPGLNASANTQSSSTSTDNQPVTVNLPPVQSN